jgi:hypothetical protein
MTTELSLTVPITNSLAFLFTVLGEWWAEKKIINRGRFDQRVAFLVQRYTANQAWSVCASKTRNGTSSADSE